MLREVATLAFLNLGGGVELFFSYNNLRKLTMNNYPTNMFLVVRKTENLRKKHIQLGMVIKMAKRE